MKPAIATTRKVAPKTSASFWASVRYLFMGRLSRRWTVPARVLRRPSKPQTCSGVRARRSARSGVPRPDDPQPFQGQVRIDAVERPRVRRDQVGEPTGRDGLRVGAELLPDPSHDPVDLAGEAVDEAGLEAADRRLADDGRRRREVDL